VEFLGSEIYSQTKDLFLVERVAIAPLLCEQASLLDVGAREQISITQKFHKKF
jgi:hypothetical protein